MIGWLHNMLEDRRGARPFKDINPEGFAYLAALNLPLENSDHRGLSEVLSLSTQQSCRKG